MPKGYKHLTYDIRCQIYALLKSGNTQSQIAKFLNLDQSSISREIRRNRGKKGYRHNQAHSKAKARRCKASSKPRKLLPDVTFFIEQSLCFKQWSPEQISGYLKRKHGILISHEIIYQYIWQNIREGGTLYKHLRCAGKKYNRRRNKSAGRGLIPHRVGIENRPQIVDLKERVGDFEIDTIIGAKHKGAIVSIVDRRTKLVRLGYLAHKTSKETSQMSISLLSPIKSHVHAITADNGKEFADHKDISNALGSKFYFANPYHSWERGLNENTNGLVRQYFPKQSDFSKLTDGDIKKVEYILNSRPKKSLNYKTPNEVFLQLTGIDANYALRC